MTTLEWLFLGLVGVPLGVIASYPAHIWITFRGERGSAPKTTAPSSVSVIVPLRGAEEGLEANLQSILCQELSVLAQVLFCVEEGTDAAAAIARRLITRYAPGSARLVLTGPAGRELGKLHNLTEGARAAHGDLLVFVDSDARLPTRTFLREFTAPLSRAEV